MINLNNYIIEKLKINKEIADKSSHNIDTRNAKNGMLISDEELHEVEELSKKLPQEPDEIKSTSTGGVKLVYKLNYHDYWGKEQKSVIRIKPRTNTYDIAWEKDIKGKTMPYVNSKPLNNIKEVFDLINKRWKKINFDVYIK